MRKNRFFLPFLILLGLFAGHLVKADYCPSYPNYNPPSGKERSLTNFALSDGMRSVNVQVNQTTNKGVSLFFDKTSTVFPTTSGRTISFSSLLWNGSWMHAYLYIDYDRNGIYNQILNSDGTTTGELVSYSYYRGKDSKGRSSSEESGVTVTSMPSFILHPTMNGGDYHVRFKVDWDNTDPCGTTEIGENGGTIVDFIINIPTLASRTITVESSNITQGTVSGGGTGSGAIICTAVANSGYYFTSWIDRLTGNRVSTDANYIDNSEGNKVLVAYFAREATVLSRSGWTTAADNYAISSNSTDGPSSYAIDGDLTKWWHSRYSTDGGGTTVYTYPHWIQFDLGSMQSFSAFNYISRNGLSVPDDGNGNVADYKLYASDKDISKKLDASYYPLDAQLISSGRFTYDGKTSPNEHKIVLDKPLTARYLLLRCGSAANGQNYAACNEFYLYSGWVKVTASVNDATMGSVYIDAPGTIEKEVFANGENSVSVTAVPNTGVLFRGWMLDGRSEIISVDNPYRINSVIKNHKIVANFGTTNLVQHNVVVSVNPSSSGVVLVDGIESPSVVESGKTAVLKAEPAKGYMLQNWTRNEKIVSTDNPFITPAVLSDISYTANFDIARGKLYLNTLDLTKGTCGNGKQITANRSMKGNPLTMKGVVYDKGISMHSPAKFIIQTNGATGFHALLGIDDDCTGSTGGASCDYKILRDGGDVVQSGTISRSDVSPVTIDIDVATWNYITLEISNGADGNNTEDSPDWVDAYFDFERVAPIAVTTEEKDANNLKLACATTFYSLPGIKLMNKFKAEDNSAVMSVLGLPAGLTFNPRRNLVEGIINIPGTYEYYVETTTSTQTKKHKITLVVDDKLLSPTPPMGWLSWNVFENEISEQKLIEVTDVFVKEGLVDYGYKYINIDDMWHASARASDGRPQYDTRKFPNGLKFISDYVHSKGMKIGIYSDAANLTCGGMYGSYQYEAIDAKQYADWGMDLLKYDYCYAPKDMAVAITRYTAMSNALKATGRNFLFYICEWGQLKPWAWAGNAGGHCWRTTYDSRDTWTYGSYAGGLCGVIEGIDEMNKVAYYTGVNNYNDADMMMVGLYGTGKSSNHGNDGKGMTNTEYQSQFSIWCMYASPLWLSFDIRNMNEATRTILKNREVLDINQDPMCQQAILIKQGVDSDIYMKDLANGDIAVALLNRGASSQMISINYNDLFLDDMPGYDYKVRDLWAHEDVNITGRVLKAQVASHETKVYRISKVYTGINITDMSDVTYKVNAGKNEVRIDCSGVEGKQKHIDITDLSARVVVAMDVVEDKIIIPHALSEGIYIVNINCNGKSYSCKVIIK
ncbi:MAG: NPCBM/NEW2 domain-containing protein [Bacteroidales bacterium]